MKLKLKNGLEILLSQDESNKLANELLNKSNAKYVLVAGQLISVFEIEGIFSNEALTVSNKLKSGKWQCARGNWHNRFDARCDCSHLGKLRPIFNIRNCEDILEIKNSKQYQRIG